MIHLLPSNSQQIPDRINSLFASLVMQTSLSLPHNVPERRRLQNAGLQNGRFGGRGAIVVLVIVRMKKIRTDNIDAVRN
jgi:hypothetical protein